MNKPAPILMPLLGVLTLICTIWVQVRTEETRASADGEFRGWIRQVIMGQQAADLAHEKTLEAHAKELQEHDRTIIGLESRLHGISTKLGQLPGKVASKIDNHTTDNQP